MTAAMGLHPLLPLMGGNLTYPHIRSSGNRPLFLLLPPPSTLHPTPRSLRNLVPHEARMPASSSAFAAAASPSLTSVSARPQVQLAHARAFVAHSDAVAETPHTHTHT
eukprot:GHVU01097754.1.p2 GENE.GHVU01097754.1~~GHVU01097754.1.p2  ORF type:complete len:108 (+),score=5.02 GHVU01097754.1:357-680(+)